MKKNRKVMINMGKYGMSTSSISWLTMRYIGSILTVSIFEDFWHCFDSSLSAKPWHIRYTERSCDVSRDQCSGLKLTSSLQYYASFWSCSNQIDHGSGYRTVVALWSTDGCGGYTSLRWMLAGPQHSQQSVRRLSRPQFASSLQHYQLFRYATEQIYCSSKYLTKR